jgi:hypothetical protein
MPIQSALPIRRSLFPVPSLLAVALLFAAPAHAGDLAAFLERAERMATANEKVEANVTVREADGTTRKAHLAIDPAAGGTLVFEQPDLGWKSETPLAWKEGKAVSKTGAASAAIGVDDPLGGTDLRGIDFFPFWHTDYSKALSSDENTTDQTVTLYTDAGRPYSLYVITFDKAKLVPKMIKLYRNGFSNLVRIRTDQNYVMIGSRPRPTEVLIRDFAGNTLRTYAFEWKLVDATK